jgi:hypothetical protein
MCMLMLTEDDSRVRYAESEIISMLQCARQVSKSKCTTIDINWN